MTTILWVIIAIVILLVLYFLMTKFGSKKKETKIPPQTS